MNKTSRLLNHLIFSILMVGFISLPGYGQEEYKDPKNKALNELYPGGSFYEVQNYVQPSGKKQPKNIILMLSLIHISEHTRLGMISYAVFCLKKKKHI